MSSSSYPPRDDYPGSSHQPEKASSGLRLVLPSLSALKAQKTKKKIKLTYGEPVKKQPRPVKLKPLKEVLTRLIVQIKKKDDYAFFLQPVDLAAVPNYTDVIARPMDLGTMTTKVEKGKYRSLEEFASDLKLVTTNAKTFNPPGTIYHTEAERIENFALDHITKAAATVIEYETDWNIDVEKDDEPVAVDDEDGGSAVPGTPMDVDESRAGSPSAMAMQVGGKRGKGKKQVGVSETLEPDGGLPGAKDGLGAFPPGSDWADLMLALKLKGKRYRTKKERIRMERGGPPVAADGSVDYPEMEDPFTVLSAMVPDPMSRPYLTPVYPTPEPSTSNEALLPAPVHIIPASNISAAPIPSTSSSSLPKHKHIKPTKRRHWVINAPSRNRAKEVPEEEPVLAWKNPREAATTDFGSFGILPSVVADERKVGDVGTELGSQSKLFNALRESVQARPDPVLVEVKMETDEDGYWAEKAGEAEAYIRDVVYGGVDGYAYVRSLAEFLAPPDAVQQNGEPPTYGDLRMPVAQWVEANIVDPLTGGRHRVLHETAKLLNGLPPTPPLSPPPTPPSTDSPAPSGHPPLPIDIARQVDLSLHAYPAAARAHAALRAIYADKIDLAALLRAPDELFHAEDVWAGKRYRERRRREMDDALARDPAKNAAAYLQWAIAEHREAEASVGFGAAAAATAGATGDGAGAGESEEAGMLAYALEVAAQEILRLAGGAKAEDGDADAEAEEEAVADALRALDPESETGAILGADADGDVVMKAEEEEDAVMKAEEEEEEEEEEEPAGPSEGGAPAAGAGAFDAPPAVNGSAAAPPPLPPSSTAAAIAKAEADAGGGSGGGGNGEEERKDDDEDPVLKKLRLNLLALAKRAPLDQIMKLPPELVPAHLRHIVPTADA